jgi:hypothetical protein
MVTRAIANAKCDNTRKLGDGLGIACISRIDTD